MDSTTEELIVEGENLPEVVLEVILAFFGIVLIIAIIWYALNAFGFYRLAKNRGISHAWIAWIPICQYYLLGELIGNRVWKMDYANWILIIGSLVVSLMSTYYSNVIKASGVVPTWFAVIYLIITLVYYCYAMTARYKLYQIYSNHPVAFLIFSIIFPFLSSIFIFIIRNNEPKEEYLYPERQQ